MQQTIIKFKFKFKSNDFYISNKNELAYKFIKVGQTGQQK